jgi:hypothetical protein
MKIRLLMISLSILILGMAIYSAGCEKKVDAPVQESTAKACPADCMKPCCVAETVWTCTMHPQILEEKAGKCSMCAMNLIPVEPDADKVSEMGADTLPGYGQSDQQGSLHRIQRQKGVFLLPGM